jgi:putative endonuclease
MKTMWVYIVECSDGLYYTGVTNDVERRVQEHNEGLDTRSFTYRRRPIILKFANQFNDPIQAIEFEKQVKGWSRKKKQAIIEEKWELLPGFSKSKT